LIIDLYLCRLRLFSLIPLACALYSARSLYHRQETLLRTVAIVELSTSVLISFSPVLLLSLSILLGALIASIPFISLLLRLLLVGYFTHASDTQGIMEWHIRAYAAWLLVAVSIVWLWSLGWWGTGTLRRTLPFGPRLPRRT
jgi:hypothetical protein